MATTFNYIEGVTTVKNFLMSIATDLTTVENHKWTLESPASVSSITNSVILKTETSFKKTFYLKIEKEISSINHCKMSIGTELTDDKSDFAEGYHSHPARFAWYRENRDIFLGDWLPIEYWISFNTDFINIIVQGDPSPDQEPYSNYLISYAYVGALAGYEGADEDVDYNFGLTVSSDKFYEGGEFPKEFGNRTGTGITDIVMVGTRTGTPFQAHYPSFHAIDPFMDKNFIGSSNWTHKHHTSEITVVHAYDRERGKLQNVLIGDRSSLFHKEDLIENKGTEDEKVFKMFNINAPFNFINNSANVLYGIMIRKS